MWKWIHLPALTGNLIQPLRFSQNLSLQSLLVTCEELPSGCPLCSFQLFPFSCDHVRMRDRSQGRTKKPFSSRWVKETLTSQVFKLSHKSVAFRQIEQNEPFQEPQWSSMSALGTKGAPARKSLNGCIILPVAAPSKGPFHVYRHLLLAFLQFLWEAADGFHCFNKKLNRRGNADWRQKPVILPNPCSAFSWSTTVTAICLVSRRERNVRAQSMQICLLLPSQCWFLGSHLTQRIRDSEYGMYACIE